MKPEHLIVEWQSVRAGLLTTIDKFKDEDLAYIPFEGSWPVAGLLLHIAQEELGEVGYGMTHELDAWPEEFSSDDYPDLEKIKILLAGVHQRTGTFMESLDEAALDRIVETPWKLRASLAALLLHTLEHEIHHRGELSLILGLLGRPGLDA
jgi:uncharacterized damage-inducible protein DinB